MCPDVSLPGSAGLLRQDVLSLAQSGELLATAVLGCLVIAGLGHALLLEVVEVLGVISVAGVRGLELTFGNSLRLLSGGLLALRLGKLLLAVLDRIFQPGCA